MKRSHGFLQNPLRLTLLLRLRQHQLVRPGRSIPVRADGVNRKLQHSREAMNQPASQLRARLERATTRVISWWALAKAIATDPKTCELLIQILDARPKELQFSFQDWCRPEAQPSEEEVALHAKMAVLKLQIAAGNGDADSEDVGADGSLMSVQAAADSCQAELTSAAAARMASATYALPFTAFTLAWRGQPDSA